MMDTTREVSTVKIGDFTAYLDPAAQRVEFKEGDELLFIVPHDFADTEEKRRHLISAFLAGKENGYAWGYRSYRYQLQKLIGMKD